MIRLIKHFITDLSLLVFEVSPIRGGSECGDSVDTSIYTFFLLKSVYLSSKLLLRQVSLKTMEHDLIFLVVIFQVFLLLFFPTQEK